MFKLVAAVIVIAALAIPVIKESVRKAKIKRGGHKDA